MTNLRKRGHETVNYFLVFNNYGSDNLDNTLEYQWLSRDFVIVLSTKRSVICVEDRIVLKQWKSICKVGQIDQYFVVLSSDSDRKLLDNGDRDIIPVFTSFLDGS